MTEFRAMFGGFGGFLTFITTPLYIAIGMPWPYCVAAAVLGLSSLAVFFILRHKARSEVT